MSIELEEQKALIELTGLSRQYGSDSEYVIAGGGNTSFKDSATLWVKGSGVSLGEISPGDFVMMDREKLAAVWKKSYPEGMAEREEAVLADMLAARKKGEENKRPSVETLLHDILPFPWVVHLHPALVNGITCSVDGKNAASRLFGGSIWIPSENPGYILSLRVKEALEKNGTTDIIFLQNHGIFAAAATPEKIKSLYKRIMDTIEAEIKERPDFSGAVSRYGASDEAGSVFAECAEGMKLAFVRNNAIAGLVRDRNSFQPVSSAFTPDHIVYAGSDPLFVENPPEGKNLRDHIMKAWREHTAVHGRMPKIAALEGTGVFGIGLTEKAANLALELFADTIKVAVYARSFGGHKFMEADKIAFINNWEAERYRSQRSGS
jgi:rhamnose utilization protein RhaD (predicted bifunctional aldolase and dehydrogenase)